MDEESYITFACPKCGNSVEYLEQYVGTAQVCPYCSEDVVVPRDGDEKGATLPLPIETSRLILRRLRSDDFPDAFEFLSDTEVYRYDERPPMDEDEAKRWLDRTAKGKLSDPEGELTLGIALKDNGRLVGFVRLKYRDANRKQAGLGAAINSKYHRQGFAYEALHAALQFSFRDIGLHRVVAMCDSRNAAGVALLTKLGMRNEAECLRDRFVDGEWSDSLWFAMLEEEFPHGQPNK